MASAREAGAGSLALILSALAGLILAVLGSFAMVVAGTAVPSKAVDKPLITYDSR
jgi:hypothetical protein